MITKPSATEIALGLPGETLLAVHPVVGFVTIAVRNAWHNTRSRTYQRGGGLHVELSAAKAEAERRRKPGTRFVIHETPALLLMSERRAVLRADFHAKNPFGALNSRAVGKFSEPLMLSKAHEILSHWGVHWGYWTTGQAPLADSLLRTWLDEEQAAQAMPIDSSADGPLSHYSRSFGGGYLLGWDPEPNDSVADGVMRAAGWRSAVSYSPQELAAIHELPYP
ncbi:hypothetical protein [Galactobacter valiniphilus]|uniref:hypothetical protein n=1 Tax=Galactobacter valiniphilus TaxID=2676122 RepID=UPI0037360310